ncbi:MAG: hypothetical protein H6673_06810 [Anaerolineales bacterium]|nr:hypothetical protein [Anaerolineales bacterium]
MRFVKFSILLILLSILVVSPVQAQRNPVVYGVFFYSPTCSHCHKVITEDLPPLQDQYGEQFQVLFVNVRTVDGRQMLYDACDALDVPSDRCGGVPMMVVGSTVMIGEVQIPTQLPQLIEDGLAAGGIPVPAIPGLTSSVVDQALEAQNSANDSTATTTNSNTAVSTAPVEELTWIDRFNDDWEANSLAIVVVLMLLGSLTFQLNSGWHVYNSRRMPKRRDDNTWQVVFGLTLFAVLLAFSLILKQEGLSLILAMAVVALLASAAALLWRAKAEKRTLSAEPILPLMALAGLLVAGYLTYIEVGNNEAVCGAIGNCNTVQESDYATFLGIIPIGVLGVIGYVLILAAWQLTQLKRQDIAQYAHLGLLGLIIFGVAFSVYLTFLEPFVIGATCMWCLTSAVLMMMLLWLQAPQGWRALMKWSRAHHPAK